MNLWERIKSQELVVEAWEDAVERTWIALDVAVRSASPDAGQAKDRHRRARNQARSASDHLQALRDQIGAGRPGGANYGAR